MKIGNIDLGERPVTLAPMEDVTDASFRILCREAGAAMVTTEFVSSDGLVRDVSKTIAKMHTLEEEAPVAVQIYGSIPEAMVDAAKMADKAAELAGGHGADIVDINFGCPVSKIAGRGAGSGMMREPDKMVAITKAIVEAVDKPVTVKTRLGWDDKSKIIVELAERLQDCGIQALTIHGRTRAQMYTGQADWTLIGKVKENPRMKIPIIGNGDITTPERAKECFDRYGVDAIMIGRGSFGRPWIFEEVKHYLKTGEKWQDPGFQWKMDVLKQETLDSIARLDERRGIVHIRRHLAASPLFKGLEDFRHTRIEMLRAETVEELFAIMDRIIVKWGACQSVPQQPLSETPESNSMCYTPLE